MGRIIVRKMRGMSLKTKVALTVFVTLLASVFMYQGWYLPMRVQANIVTYYLNPYTATNVGIDGTTNMTTYADIDYVAGGNQKRGLMDLNQPTSSTRYRLYDFSGATTFTNQEFYRCYGPAYAVDTQIDANAFAEFEAYMIIRGTSASVAVQLFDYNPATGAAVQIGSTQTKTLSQASTALQRFNNGTGTAAYFGNGAYKVLAGHRLELRFLVSASASQPALLLYANPSNTPSGSARLVVNESVIANLAVSNGTAEPASITIGPSPNGVTSYPVDSFGLQLDGTAYDFITTVSVTLGAGNSQYISKVMITNTDNTTVYGSLSAPTSGETWTMTTTSMPAYGLQASGDPVDYHVRIIPKSHTVINPPPGGTYSITGRVSAVTHSQLGAITLGDSGSATITVDNASPANPTWGAVTHGNAQVQLNWTNPVTDFSGVIILRNTEPSADAPIEGRTYGANNYIGTSVVVYAGSGTTFTDTTAGNGTAYYYKIFAYDAYGNYSLGVQDGPHTPSNPNKTTPGIASALASSATSIIVKMPYTGDPNANNTYTVNYRIAGAGGWTNKVTNAPHSASPYTTTISGLTAGQQYEVQCIYNDADGINVDPPTNSYTATISGIDMPMNSTIPGTVQASAAGTSTINIEMPYSGDTNGNNTYFVEWEDAASPGVWKNKSGTHSTNPYITSIAGLAAGHTYNVRMTYQDADGVSGGSGAVQTVAGVALQSATDTGLLHNSLRFVGTTKWGGSWGVDGGKYGAITCATCHQPAATNIKGMRSVVSAASENFPGGANTTITFMNVTSMANDAGGHATSTRVCEACHSQTKFHRYNTAGQPGALTHFNNDDCTDCHFHNKGFRGGCDTCHGNPPTTNEVSPTSSTGLAWKPAPTGATSPVKAGAHQRHAVTRGMLCVTCHNGNTMPVVDRKIQIGFNAISSNVPGFKGSMTFGNFSGNNALTNSFAFQAMGSTTVGTSASYRNSCSVACHGNWTGSNGTVKRPSWVEGSTAGACGACHGYNAATAPTRGSHTKHASNAAGKYGMLCTKCHPTVSNNDHVNGNVQWALNSTDVRITASARYKGVNASGTRTVAPSSSYGQCSNLYCHSNGLNAASPTYRTPTWGDTLDCTGCHGSKATLATGSHTKHLLSAECANCHNQTLTSGSTNISDTTIHVDKSVNLKLPAGGNVGTATYGAANFPVTKTSTGTFTTCTNVKCHNDGTGVWNNTWVMKVSPTWGAAGGCDKCHGNATYPSDYRKAAPLYADGTPKPNAHYYHVDRRAGLGGNGEIHCSDCHSTVTANNTTINGTNPAHHGNNAYNLAQGASAGTFYDGDNTGNSTTITVVLNYGPSPATSTCVNVSCHPVGLNKDRGTSEVKWNSKYTCIECHSIGMEQTDTFHHAMRNYSTSYPAVAPNGSATNGTNPTTRRCTMCHVDHDKFSPTLNTNSAGRAYNLRTGIDVPVTANSGFTNTDFVKSGSGGICISCHSSEKTKDTTRRRNDTGVTVTPAITYVNYTGSVHQYNVPAKMLSDGSTVNGNCSKCHNALTNETSVFMNITTAAGSMGLSFGNHNSGIRRLQGSLGAAGGETAEEQICYRCHSPYSATETPGGGPSKAIGGKDYYGVQTMSAASEGIYGNMKIGGARAAAVKSYTNKLYFKPITDASTTLITPASASRSYPIAPVPDAGTDDNILESTWAGGTYTVYSMSPWDPVIGYTTKSVTSNQSGLRYWKMAKFVSPVVTDQVTVPAGSWVINMYCRESSTSLNGRIRYTVYKWGTDGAPSSDAQGPTIIAKGTYATELATTAAPGANRQISINVPATTLYVNQKIVVDLALETNEGTTSGTRTGNFYFGMGAPSNLTLPGFVYFDYNDPGTNGFGHNAGMYSGIHRPSPTDETQAYISANKHVECNDCHNPHATKAGLHTANNAALATVLREVQGVAPNYAGPVASTYYFTNGAPASPPAAHQSTDAWAAGSFVVKDMGTSRGGGMTSKTSTTTNTASGSNYRGVAFISPALSAGTIPAGNWTLNVWASQNNINANVGLKAYIYLWKANSTKVAIGGPTSSGEIGNGAGTGKYLESWTVAGSSVVASAGDRLAVEVYPSLTGISGSTAYTTTTYWNGNVAGTDDSNIVAPSGAAWVTAGSFNPQIATTEYQICFKCHSGANSNVLNWSAPGSPAPTGSKAWTDLSVEFNPSNKSGHPVIATLNASSGRTAAKGIGTAAMKAPWNTSAGNNIMTCADCHGANSAVTKGPHGSSVKWMLRGTNKAWPFTTAAGNGTTSGTTFKLGNYSLNNGADDGLFCLNCHTVTMTNWYHDNVGGGEHGSWASAARGACVSCHIRVPHGGKASRLTRPATAASLGRYAPNGMGAEVAGQSDQVFSNFTKPGTWGASSSFTDGPACNEHTGGTETW